MGQPQGPDIAPPGEENVRIDKSGTVAMVSTVSVVLVVFVAGFFAHMALTASTTSPKSEFSASDIRLHRLKQVEFDKFWKDDEAPLVEIDYDMPIGIWEEKCGIIPNSCGVTDVESKIGKEKVKLQIIKFPDRALRGADLDAIRKRIDLAGFRMANARELIGLGQALRTNESRRALYGLSCEMVSLDKVGFINYLGISIPTLYFMWRKRDGEIKYYLEIGDCCFSQGYEVIDCILVVYK